MPASLGKSSKPGEAFFLLRKVVGADRKQIYVDEIVRSV